MKIEITNEYVSYYRKSKDITIDVEIDKDKTIELSFCKWAIESDNETDAGWDFDNKSQEIYDNLDEEVQDEIYDFISDIKL
jgi:hypothetical protein